MDIYELRKTMDIDESTAREYFGESFIRTYEHIRQICNKKDLGLFLHGTFIDNSKSILEKGLIAKSNNIGTTMASAKNYADMLNWRVQHIGGIVESLVILTIPKDCIINRPGKERRGLWHGIIEKYNETIEDYEDVIDDNKIIVDKYAIPVEFIRGYIDLKNKSISFNRYYDSTYNSDKLFLDENLTHSIIPEKKSNIITKDDPEWGDDELER